jgi:hypothetical protein
MKTFDTELMHATGSPPSATQLAARAALTLWALLPSALAEAEAARDDAMTTRLLFLKGLLDGVDD